MHVKTIRALLRGIWAARADLFEDAVLAFNTADDYIRRSRRRIPWNVDAVLRRLIPASRGVWAEPPLHVLEELEELLLSRPHSPAHARRLFDRLWTSWCIRAYKRIRLGYSRTTKPGPSQPPSLKHVRRYYVTQSPSGFALGGPVVPSAGAVEAAMTATSARGQNTLYRLWRV